MGINLTRECLHYLFKENGGKGLIRISVLLWLRHNLLRKFDIPYLEIFATTRCNLRCRFCSNLIPRLSGGQDVEFKEFKRVIEAILSKVDWLCRLKIHGGEVLLHPEICKFIKFVDAQNKIKSIRITTNGAVDPTEDVLRCLADSKAVVQVSNYKVTAEKAFKLIEKFKTYGVKYIFLADGKWRDMGDLSEGDNRYEECSIKRCTSIYNGKIYVCSRAAVMENNGMINSDEGISVDMPEAKLKKEWKALYKGKYNIACSYCYGDTVWAKSIIPGEQ